MIQTRTGLALALFLGIVSVPRIAAASDLSVQAAPILRQIYSFDFAGGVAAAQNLQQSHPNDPLGYLLEAEALGWKIWCTSAEYKYGFTAARRRAKLPQDQRYLELAEKVTSLAEAQLKEQDSAEMHFFAGMGQALSARLYGLRGENRSVARMGVRARQHFLKALELDPNLADANFGLGLYNYYVDTLSGIARVLRFFMGIPAGSKEAGLRQLQQAIDHGELAREDATFYLALNSIMYDRNYERALAVVAPLVQEYPSNPLFLLLRGDALAKLARNEQAAASYRAALAVPVRDSDCAARVQILAEASLDALGLPAAAQSAPH